MRLILTLVLLIIVRSLVAQNLPTVQKESIHSPVKIKIDGKLDEWDNKFQAYNKNTKLYYTVSNDANNLYLTIQAVDGNTIKKILAGGLTFTLNNSNKKKDSTAIAFTFPVYEQGQKLVSIGNQLTSANNSQIDSFATAYNRQLTTTFKVIGVNGLKDISNGTISTYNDNKIKAVARFDKDMHYNYELAIPLNSIGSSPSGSSKFNYNIQLNGQKKFDGYAIESAPGRPNMLFYVDNNGQRNSLDTSASTNTDLYYTTDFWGEYTLIR